MSAPRPRRSIAPARLPVRLIINEIGWDEFDPRAEAAWRDFIAAIGRRLSHTHPGDTPETAQPDPQPPPQPET